MEFYIPVRVLCEDNCVANHRKELAVLGRKALLVTGAHSAEKNGSLKDVEEALSANGQSFLVFNRIEENPSVETVMKGSKAGLSAGADFVIGIGGGSPMDAAKAIAMMMAHRDKDGDFLYEKGEDSKRLPLCLIPTTCGTGSEVTGVSVLTRPSLSKKGSIPHKLFADLALLDPVYLLSAPASVLCNTAVDALCHLMESGLHVKATDYSRMFVREGLTIFGRTRGCLLSLKKGGKLTKEDASSLLLASNLAGMAIAHTGTGIPHALSYDVTLQDGIPHGAACGYFLPGFLREQDPARVQELLSFAGFSSVDDLKGFYDSVCGAKPKKESLMLSVEHVFGTPAKLATSKVPVDKEMLYRIAGLE